MSYVGSFAEEGSYADNRRETLAIREVFLVLKDAQSHCRSITSHRMKVRSVHMLRVILLTDSRREGENHSCWRLR